MTSVLIVDDQELVRTGLRMILESEPDLDVVGEAGDGLEALALARRLKPEVVMMDVRMPVLDGLAATRRLAGTAGGDVSRVLVLTTFDHSETVYEALVAGASGFLLKDAPAARIVAGVRAVARGEELLDPAITRRLIESFVGSGRAPLPPGYDELTAREREVLALMARGLSNAELAAQLVLGETTVKTHVARVLAKLGLRDRVQAVIFAYEAGLVRPQGMPNPGSPAD
ncbi:MAG: response regulator [Solirubrobacteraceae bacterium]